MWGVYLLLWDTVCVHICMPVYVYHLLALKKGPPHLLRPERNLQGCWKPHKYNLINRGENNNGYE